MPKIPPTVCALLLCLATGCMSANSHCHGGALVSDCRIEDQATTTIVPYTATYALYQWKGPPAGQPPPISWSADEHAKVIYVRSLEQQDQIGFEKGNNEQLFAVAGEEKIPLDPGRYCWHVTEATERRGLALAVHDICDTVTEIVSLPFELAFAIIFLPLIAFFAWMFICHA
jgi:hypothetical protein